MGQHLSVEIYKLIDYYASIIGMVRQHPELLEPGETLKKAVQRYVDFMQEIPEKEQALKLDVTWIWCVHCLNPISYRNDCMKAYNDVRPFAKIFNMEFSNGNFMPSIDLEEAAVRQRDFIDQCDDFISDSKKAYFYEHDYFKFLKLVKKYGKLQTLVPTFGMELFWRAHILDPIGYLKDCKNLVGFFVNHDDTIPRELLPPYLRETQSLSKKEFGGLGKSHPYKETDASLVFSGAVFSGFSNVGITEDFYRPPIFGDTKPYRYSHKIRSLSELSVSPGIDRSPSTEIYYNPNRFSIAVSTPSSPTFQQTTSHVRRESVAQKRSSRRYTHTQSHRRKEDDKGIKSTEIILVN